MRWFKNLALALVLGIFLASATAVLARPLDLLSQENYTVQVQQGKRSFDLGKFSGVDRVSKAAVGFGQVVDGKNCLVLRGPSGKGVLRFAVQVQLRPMRGPRLKLSVRSSGEGRAALTIALQRRGEVVKLFEGILPRKQWRQLELPLRLAALRSVNLIFEVATSEPGTFALLADPKILGLNDTLRKGSGYVMTGMRITPEGGLKLRVAPGSAEIDGKVVQVEAPVSLEVEPPRVVTVLDEPHTLPTGKLDFMHGARLKGPLCSYHAAGDSLIPNSVVVKSAPGSKGEEYAPGVDYLVHPDFGTLIRLEKGKIKADQTVYIDYKYSLQRIDSVVLESDGTVKLLKGEDKLVLPLPPAVPEGALRLANIYVPFQCKELSEDDILPIIDRSPCLVKARDRHAEIPKTWAKLQAKEPVTIVCFGDSVTVGGDVPVEADKYVNRLAAGLQARFPDVDLKVVNAGVGGTGTIFGLERFDKDVAAYKPDLVTVMFPLNDCGLSDEQLRHNMVTIIERCRKLGAEVILMTSNSSLWGEPRLSQVNQMYRDLGKEFNVPVADAYADYNRLREKGIPWQSVLANSINHPDKRGHWIFYAELMNFFGGYEGPCAF